MNILFLDKKLDESLLDKELKSDDDNFCFVSDPGWNDYGYKTLFYLYFYNSNSHEWVLIDFVRLFLSESADPFDHCTEIVKFKNLESLKNSKKDGRKIWMIGQNSEFYFKLRDTINDENIMSKFLNEMNDLTKKTKGTRGDKEGR